MWIENTKRERKEGNGKKKHIFFRREYEKR
jgi:hypothetical protein